MNKKKFNTLQEYKDYHRLSAQQLAEMLCVDRVWIYKLLKHKIIPSSQLARRINEKCHIPVQNIIFPERMKEVKNGSI